MKRKRSPGLQRARPFPSNRSGGLCKELTSAVPCAALIPYKLVAGEFLGLGRDKMPRKGLVPGLKKRGGKEGTWKFPAIQQEPRSGALLWTWMM